MRSDSLNLIPSFDQIPYLYKEPGFFINQMKLIVSNKEIHSFQSLDDYISDEKQFVDGGEELSIEQDYQQLNKEITKQAEIGTHQNFKTPQKKKKTGCICKKTGCLKLYCECFSTGKICTQQCGCCNCSNIASNNEQVENVRSIRKNRSKNLPEKRVCNCKKTQCQKKYCECFNAGVSCNSDCKCDGCNNHTDNNPHSH